MGGRWKQRAEYNFNTGKVDMVNDPTKRFYPFSPLSARKAHEQYKQVYQAAHNAVSDPRAFPDDRAILSELLRSPDFKPQHTPWGVYLNDDQWRALTRGLRHWQSEGMTPEYNIMLSAKRRRRLSQHD